MRRVNVDAARLLVNAIRSGNVVEVRELLSADTGLATARIHGGRTALHVVTDWPGYFPNGPDVADVLIRAGADPNARTAVEGPGETPLHWAASTDDVDVADVLIDAGADIEAPEGSIGTPLDNAIGYGCWHVARRLVESGAAMNKLWHAAALGRLSRMDELLAAARAPTPDELTEAFWHACNGGQFRAAQRLLDRGADINSHPGYVDNRPIEAAADTDTRRQQLVNWLRANGGRPSQ